MRRGLLAWVVVGLVACDAPEPRRGPSVGTNSNWLMACAQDGECEELPACSCGACTIPCQSDGECAELANARCVQRGDPAGLAACGAGAPAAGSGLCLPECEPGACSDEQACVDGTCVLAPSPSAALCQAVATRDAALRAREEGLLALLAELREAGGGDCGAGPLAPQPALRFDPRLRCAARVLAEDIVATAVPDVTDAEGRGTAERLSQAGYTARMWGDGFAIAADSVAEARELILADADSCTRLLGEGFGDIGVGAAGDVLVVTIAAQ